MTWRERRALRRQRRANLRRHSALHAHSGLPEAHDSRFARRIIYTLLATLLAIIVWAGSTPVNEITSGNGTVITRLQPARIEHPDGGLVAKVHVKRGQRIAAGMTILEFDTASLFRELGKLKASQAALAAESGRVAFLLDQRGDVPRFDTQDNLAPEEILFWAEQSFLTAQLDLIQAERTAILSTLEGLETRRNNLDREIDLLRGRVTRTRRGQASGAIALNEVERQERELLQLERSLLDSQNEIATQKNALDTNQLKKSELLAKRRREAALRQAEIAEKIVSIALSIAEVQSRIDRARIVATASGTVMDLAVAHAGEVIAPGDPIAEIIPENSAVEAEIEISADRIGNVDVGMEARLKVLSYDFTRYGEIVGEVLAISPSSFENEEGLSVYRVTIGLPNGGVDAELTGRPIRPGMTVTADILNDSKKVLTYLLKPLRVLGDRAFSEA